MAGMRAGSPVLNQCKESTGCLRPKESRDTGGQHCGQLAEVR